MGFLFIPWAWIEKKGGFQFNKLYVVSDNFEQFLNYKFIIDHIST